MFKINIILEDYCFALSQRAFRAIVTTHGRHQTKEELEQFHQIIKPVIERILVKCSNANRFVQL